MDLHLTPEAAAKLNDLAVRTHRDPGELLVEAVDHLVEWNLWYEDKVMSSIAAVERGETISDDEVRVWLEKRKRSRADRMVWAGRRGSESDLRIYRGERQS